MTTGAYLQAMVSRHLVDHTPTALTRARRCYGALKHIYDLGKGYEEGFFPKIYGGKLSNQTSTDQVLYCAMALDRYWPLADALEQRQISHMIAEMVRFWVRRDYKFGYYDRPEIEWPLVRFPALLLLAYNHSHDESLKREYHRLLALGVTDAPEFLRLAPKQSGETPTAAFEEEADAWLIIMTPDYMGMDVMQFDYKLRNDPDNERCAGWRNAIGQVWAEARIMLAPGGKAHFCVLVDRKTGDVCRPDDRLPDDKIPESIYTLREAKWARATMTARSAVQAAGVVPGSDDMVSAARHILASMTIGDMVSLVDIDMSTPERVPPRYGCRSRFLCGDTMANWLWAYWQGRHQDLW
ncbi:MAG: hypothetical protein HON70_27015 [Lentisphaerae bacterium]|nr:hypothetical protein [Lentisphaerota bacterium]